jgi:Mn2+/Fe2+ NRAMP family transporter
LIISIVGTTVAPWQLFFQQSNVIDKRITSRWINYERVDTIVGAFVTVLGAGALIAITAFAFGGTPLQGAFSDAGGVASGLQHTLGDTAGAFYAIVLLNASLIGAAAVTLATSYAVGDAFGAHHSLHKSLKDAKLFYTSFMLCIALAGAIVLIPKAPLGLITQSVQALAGLLLPNATVFLLLLCNDRQVLGPWVNPRWLNAVASVIVAVLLTLSATLVITTLFSDLDVRVVVSVLGGLFFGGLCLGGVVALRRSARQAPQAPATVPREEWTMAPLALLERPSWSGARKAGMYMMGGYLLVTVALLIVKAIELAS